MAGKQSVIWSIESSHQIEKIKEYLLQNWSKREIHIFLDKLKKFESLVTVYPNLYPRSESNPNDSWN